MYKSNKRITDRLGIFTVFEITDTYNKRFNKIKYVHIQIRLFDINFKCLWRRARDSCPSRPWPSAGTVIAPKRTMRLVPVRPSAKYALFVNDGGVEGGGCRTNEICGEKMFKTRKVLRVTWRQRVFGLLPSRHADPLPYRSDRRACAEAFPEMRFFLSLQRAPAAPEPISSSSS